MYRNLLTTMVLLLVFSVIGSTCMADEAAIRIIAPASVKPGTVVTVRLEIRHDGNNFLHYVEEVTVKAGEEEIQRWEYSNFDKPESQEFTREFDVTVDREIDLTARADCNLHGSAGPDSLSIKTSKGE